MLNLKKLIIEVLHKGKFRYLVSKQSYPLFKTKLTAKTVDEDHAGCQRWISRKEI